VLTELHGQVAPSLAHQARGVGQRDAGGAQHGAGIAVPERGQLLDLPHDLHGKGTERGLRVDEELCGLVALGHLTSGRLAEGRAERLELGFLEGQPGRGGMAAVRNEVLPARFERRVEIEAGQAPAGADPRSNPEGIPGDEDHRPVVLLGQAPRHDPEHTRMPAGLGEDQRRVALQVALLLDLLGSGQRDAPLEGLATAVQPVEVLRQLAGPVRTIRDQELHAELRLAEAAGGVQAWGQLEADVLGVQWALPVEPGDPDQRGQPRPMGLPETTQAVVHKDPVLVQQRHDVGDGPQGGQPHGLQEKIAHGRSDLARAAGLLADGPSHFQRDAGAAQPAKRIRRAGQAGVDDGRRLGESRAWLVVIRDDQAHAPLLRQRGLFAACDPAVDRDDQLRALVGEPGNGLAVQAVPFVEAVGQVVPHLGAQQLQALAQDGGAAHAVDVVVPVDHYATLLPDRLPDGLGGLRATGQAGRVTEVGQPAVEELPGLARVGDAATDQQLGDDGRDRGGTLQGRDLICIMRMDPPPLAHGRRGPISSSRRAWCACAAEGSTSSA